MYGHLKQKVVHAALVIEKLHDFKDLAISFFPKLDMRLKLSVTQLLEMPSHHRYLKQWQERFPQSGTR